MRFIGLYGFINYVNLLYMNSNADLLKTITTVIVVLEQKKTICC